MSAIALSLAGTGGSRFSSFFPDRRSRVRWALRASIVLLHAIFAGPLFLFDSFLIRMLKEDPWYFAMYLVLFVTTLVQYLLTSCSSPGYVIDAMKAVNGTHATFVNVPNMSIQSASGDESLDSTKDHNLLGRRNCQTNALSWFKLVMELYPPGQSTRNWTCLYCNAIQPPRSKHCNECHKCVLKFDHHCAWLGTCIGRGNHCRFWWYILEETILCIWTGTLYVTFLRLKIQSWWKDFVVIALLALLIFCLVFLLLLLLFHSYLLLTNQTTYEIIRRRRILYLKEIPASVHPFSRGIYRNLHSFCCSRDSVYTLEAVPSMELIEARARPYTCSEIITCHCC